jgi:hypothetical protein
MPYHTIDLNYTVIKPASYMAPPRLRAVVQG